LLLESQQYVHPEADVRPTIIGSSGVEHTVVTMVGPNPVVSSGWIVAVAPAPILENVQQPVNVWQLVTSTPSRVIVIVAPQV
jgi:hypothetical protein